MNDEEKQQLQENIGRWWHELAPNTGFLPFEQRVSEVRQEMSEYLAHIAKLGTLPKEKGRASLQPTPIPPSSTAPPPCSYCGWPEFYTRVCAKHAEEFRESKIRHEMRAYA